MAVEIRESRRRGQVPAQHATAHLVKLRLQAGEQQRVEPVDEREAQVKPLAARAAERAQLVLAPCVLPAARRRASAGLIMQTLIHNQSHQSKKKVRQEIGRSSFAGRLLVHSGKVGPSSQGACL